MSVAGVVRRPGPRPPHHGHCHCRSHLGASLGGNANGLAHRSVDLQILINDFTAIVELRAVQCTTQRPGRLGRHHDGQCRRCHLLQRPPT